jgi:carboxymethylenebutenolidase
MVKPEQTDGNKKPPTGKRVEVPLVAIVRFRDSKLAHEHILLRPSIGARSDRIDRCRQAVRSGCREHAKVLDPTLPANELMKCAESSK